MSMTALQIIDYALRNINVLYTGQASTTDQRSECLEALQVMLRSWSASGLMVYYIEEAETHTLTSGTAHYTIGSGGDIDTVRPVKIINAYVREGGEDYPVAIIQAGEYAKLWNKSDTGTPSKLWYNPVYPLADIYLWPAGGGTLYFDSQKPLTEPTAVASSIAFAPEYDEAMAFNLSLRLAPRYSKPITQELQGLANTSLQRIKTLNAALQNEPVELEVRLLSGRWI